MTDGDNVIQLNINSVAMALWLWIFFPPIEIRKWNKIWDTVFDTFGLIHKICHVQESIRVEDHAEQQPLSILKPKNIICHVDIQSY
jgi:hypothetical protein